MRDLDWDTLLFFGEHRGALPIFAALEDKLFARFPEAQRRVQKTQITYYHRHVFACVSFARVKRKTELPETWLTLTLGLPYPLESERVAVKTEGYPGRWTTHLVLGAEEELDEELFSWLGEAYDFSERKRGRDQNMGVWKCPKCGREFKRVEQPHSCGRPTTVDEYIAAQEESAQPKLQELRQILRTAMPDAEERISWSMPTYWKGQNLIHFAPAKKHIGLYPGGEATAAFAAEFAALDVSKGTIRLPWDQELPEELIVRIARWCYEKYAK